ncbi:MAG: choice-of-anchor R domain-containing protein [Patescibacteria group bacterium]|jgi:hypothetical protein
MFTQKGQVLIIATLILAVVIATTAVLLSKIAFGNNTVRHQERAAETREVAEAGIEYAIDKLNTDPGYGGEMDVPFGDGVMDIAVSSGSGETTVTSTAYYPDKVNTKETKVIEVTVATSSSDVSFNYGVQVGDGGLILQNNAMVDGNVFSNGSISGGSGSRITGDAIVASGTSLLADATVTTQSGTFNFGNNASQARIAQSFEPTVTDTINKVELFVRKTHNNTSNATVRIVADNGGVPGSVNLATGTLLSSAAGTGSLAWIEVALSPNPTLTSGFTYWIIVEPQAINSSRYWVSGSHDNSGYGNGIGMHYNNGTSSWINSVRDYNFKTYMGSVSTSLSGVVVGDITHICDDAHYATHHGDAYAQQITNSTVECDVYYDGGLTGSTYGRNAHPGSIPQSPGQMPISDGTIADWKADAQLGGTTTGDVIISANGSIGPKEITGNLIVNGSVELEITGSLYVHGNITLNIGAEVYLSPGYNATSGVIVNDGKIIFNNNAILCGSYYDNGSNICYAEDPVNPGNYSFLMMVTTDTSQDTANPSVDISNNSQGVIVYAANGTIRMNNNAGVNEAVAYKLFLSNNAIVTYHSGLVNANFVSGPGASLTIKPGSWRIVE